MKNLDANLIARTIISLIAAFNLLATNFGWSPIDADEGNIYSTVSVIVAIVIWARGYWKNNNFTHAAKLGQIVTEQIKLQERIDQEKFEAVVEVKENDINEE